MAQYKKDLIKETIDAAALSVFAEKGYQAAKIVDISEASKISVGNIYKYYKSKEEIFYSVVPESFMDSMKAVLLRKISASSQRARTLMEDSRNFWLNNQDVIEFLVENRERILIVLKNNRGTRYENTKNEMVHFLLNSVKEISSMEHEEASDMDFILNVIYSSLIDITLKVLEERRSLQEVKETLQGINKYHLLGITGLLE